ncbi:MAG: response regulator [Terriglobia bacterium]|nr:response regulator [Terriglobia bacterium]
MAIPTLLCIDDRTQMLELRRSTLEAHNYSVKVASSGYTALKVLEETPVAAVLLEYKSEGMDAEAVAYQIKQLFPKLPIILLSAYSEMPERIMWLVDEYVLKSELPDGLFRVLEQKVRQPWFAPSPNQWRKASAIAA